MIHVKHRRSGCSAGMREGPPIGARSTPKPLIGSLSAQGRAHVELLDEVVKIGGGAVAPGKGLLVIDGDGAVGCDLDRPTVLPPATMT